MFAKATPTINSGGHSVNRTRGGALTAEAGVLVATGQEWATDTEMWSKEQREKEETDEKRNV